MTSICQLDRRLVPNAVLPIPKSAFSRSRTLSNCFEDSHAIHHTQKAKSRESWIRTSTTTFRVSRPTVRRSRRKLQFRIPNWKSCTDEIRTHRHRCLKPAALQDGVPHSKYWAGRNCSSPVQRSLFRRQDFKALLL